MLVVIHVSGGMEWLMAVAISLKAMILQELGRLHLRFHRGLKTSEMDAVKIPNFTDRKISGSERESY